MFFLVIYNRQKALAAIQQKVFKSTPEGTKIKEFVRSQHVLTPSLRRIPLHHSDLQNTHHYMDSHHIPREAKSKREEPNITVSSHSSVNFKIFQQLVNQPQLLLCILKIGDGVDHVGHIEANLVNDVNAVSLLTCRHLSSILQNQVCKLLLLNHLQAHNELAVGSILIRGTKYLPPPCDIEFCAGCLGEFPG